MDGTVTGDRLVEAAARRVPADIRGLSPDFMDWQYLAGIFGGMPATFAAPVAAKYSEKRKESGQAAANLLAAEVAKKVTKRGFTLAASDAEICDAAQEYAAGVRSLLASSVLPEMPEALAGRLGEYCAARQVAAPAVETVGGMIARLCDAGWWRRALRRSVVRQIEAQAIGLGLVHRRAGLYASDDSVKETLNNSPSPGE